VFSQKTDQRTKDKMGNPVLAADKDKTRATATPTTAVMQLIYRKLETTSNEFTITNTSSLRNTS
tara:strand:+ start:311 stop:502 length:192 start_codon:yes stop_codon:yes gene_type:complete